MRLTLYFHKDFDGIVSAALLTVIFNKLKMYHKYKYIPVDYNIMNSWLNFELDKPAAVLDFLYHPKAKYFYDHHTTTFLDSNHKRIFSKNRNCYWDQTFKSTPSIIKSVYSDIFDFLPYMELIYWADTIDSAEYSSPKDLYNCSIRYISLNKLIGHYNDNAEIIEVVKAIVDNKIDLYLADRSKLLNDICKEEKEIMLLLKRRLNIKNNICLFDHIGIKGFHRYLPYYYYPDINYTIAIYNKDENYNVSIGYNPWKKNNKINLGEIAKKYGGGGRHNVAGIITQSYAKAKMVANRVYLDLDNNILHKCKENMAKEIF